MAFTNPRGLGGEAGRLLRYTFYSASGLAWAVGDLVQIDLSANLTVKKPVNDTIPFGRVVAISGPATATSATSTILTIEVFAYNKAVVINSDAAISLGSGVSAQSNGVANYIETATAAYNGGLVVSSAAAASGYDITILYP